MGSSNLWRRSLQIHHSLFIKSSRILAWFFFFEPSSIHGWTSAFLLAVMWYYWREIESFSATMAQDGLAECDQPGKNPLRYTAMAGNWTRATERADSELSHWAIMTWDIGRTDSELSHWAIMTTGRTDSELSHWAIMTIMIIWFFCWIEISSIYYSLGIKKMEENSDRRWHLEKTSVH